jgi:hypothetical protein
VPCNSSPPGNLVTNPGFETNSIDPWSYINYGSISNVGVRETGGYTCPHYFFGTINDEGLPTVLILSQNFVVPQGFSNIEITAWVRGTRQPGDTDDTVFFLGVDGYQCGYVSTYQTNQWMQVRCGRVPVSEGTHELELQISSIASFDQSGSFSVDDVVITVID